jgi:pectate lyase
MSCRSIRNSTARRNLGYLSCGTGNPIDDCWRCDSDWHSNRQRLADCGIGFGRNAIGGRDGKVYVVTDPSDDDPVNPREGTLRHAVIQEEPLWIIFKRDMVITLREELIMNSFKTIDGRGANVHIANGACVTIQYVTNVIIHGLHIHDCRPTGNAMVRSSPSHYGWRTMADGDGVSIFGSSHVWVDHCSLSNCADGLIDAIMGSTAITLSNNYFTHHNEVLVLHPSHPPARSCAFVCFVLAGPVCDCPFCFVFFTQGIGNLEDSNSILLYSYMVWRIYVRLRIRLFSSSTSVV